jgi:cyclopropane fatty-acyl-phospholipid synthase-like methyltransferase
LNFFDLKNIAERDMELLNPTNPEKILTAGRILGLEPGQKVIDFGCGFGEVLRLWAEEFGISGVGIDVRPYACERARQKMASRGLSERIEIACSDGQAYDFQANSYDVATCIGATFIWDGFGSCLRAMKQAIRPHGKLAVGEVFWLTDSVPAALARSQHFDSELELLQIAHKEGFEIEAILRASPDDWDTYETGNWRGLLRWIEANPAHPELEQAIDHLHESQEEYLRYGRQYFGWAIFLLSPTLK